MTPFLFLILAAYAIFMVVLGIESICALLEPSAMSVKGVSRRGRRRSRA
jgi:hypothetical protein